MKIYISGLYSGTNPQPGVGIARSIRAAYPDAELIGVEYSNRCSGIHWRDFDEIWLQRPWEELNLAAHADVVAKLEARATPWSVGTVAQIAAIEALRDPGYYEAMRLRTAELRERMQAALGALPGVRAIPSVAGFLMLELSPETPPPAEVVARARHAGVLLCDASDLGRAGRRLLRVAVRDVAAQDRIVAALSGALSG